MVFPSLVSKLWAVDQTCSTDSSLSQWAHTGALFPSRIKLWLKYVWPIGSLIKINSILLLEWKEEYQGVMWLLILFYFLLLARRGEAHLSCHLPKTYDLIGPSRSEGGNLSKVISAERAAYFASLSANSLPCIPTWEGTQQKRTDLCRQEIRKSHSCTFWTNRWKLLNFLIASKEVSITIPTLL